LLVLHVVEHDRCIHLVVAARPDECNRQHRSVLCLPQLDSAGLLLIAQRGCMATAARRCCCRCHCVAPGTQQLGCQLLHTHLLDAGAQVQHSSNAAH
jgi:hypothetical protein